MIPHIPVLKQAKAVMLIGKITISCTLLTKGAASSKIQELADNISHKSPLLMPFVIFKIPVSRAFNITEVRIK